MQWLTALLGLTLIASAGQAQTPNVSWSTYRECKQKITTFFEVPVAAQPGGAGAGAAPSVNKVSPEPTLTTLDIKDWRNGGIFKDQLNRNWWLLDGVPFTDMPMKMRGWESTSQNGNQYFMTDNGRMFRRMH